MKKPLIFFAVIIGFLFYTKTGFSQSCPACSNPALQSSEKLEAGADTLRKGAFRTTLNFINGHDYQGGHPNWKGLSPEGSAIEVPLHNHIVSLDFYRFETSLEYTFATNWTIWARIPYDIKAQTATVDFVEPVSDYERESVIRNRDIHHRNETYTGLSDLRFLIAHRFNGFLGASGRLDVAVGSSLPIGKTEDDPLAAKAEGVKHLHIQFGTGTFDPLFELHYATNITDRWSLALFTMNKFPFYRNNQDYLGPVETTSGLSGAYAFSNWFSLRGTLANFSQSQAEWKGVKDPNSGLISFNGTVSSTFRLRNGLTVTPGYRFPVYQQTISGEGDVFEYGATFLLNLSYAFN
ncbi:MAG TPA: hypothetical protein PLV21_03475 [Cyclobacteriaceae bacterium]|jgi:hypothetical protein|nr:hypothetical protein [Cyclobacteriaceae bacterium]HRJ80918.1 hypothetical protein [Cyclobacteriaceae bacterium]